MTGEKFQTAGCDWFETFLTGSEQNQVTVLVDHAHLPKAKMEIKTQVSLLFKNQNSSSKLHTNGLPLPSTLLRIIKPSVCHFYLKTRDDKPFFYVNKWPLVPNAVVKKNLCVKINS